MKILYILAFIDIIVQEKASWKAKALAKASLRTIKSKLKIVKCNLLEKAIFWLAVKIELGAKSSSGLQKVAKSQERLF